MLISQGSVKDLHSEGNPEEISFLFSNRVSVFDYGAIPEEIPHRGEALCEFAKILFKDLKLPSAFLGDSQLGKAALRMQKASHPKFHLENKKLQFIPLEVIFRWGVPEGSKLLKKGFKAFEVFHSPLVEYTTKLEAFDRDLSKEEAATLVPPQTTLEKIDAFTADVALKLKNYFQSCGLQLWDGKIEIAINDKGELLLIDAITPDELRLTLADFPRVPLSKELLRRWYQKTLWPQQLQQLKNEKGQDWKKSAPPPPALGTWRVEKFSQLFLALTEVVKNKSPKPLETWMLQEKAPKVYLAGQGGRETALKWKLQNENCEIVKNAEEADAIFVSNDNDLAAGAIDNFISKAKWATGPLKAAAHIEWSKIFGKEIAQAAKIPMANWTTDSSVAIQYPNLPVIKQDGLAGGKGVALPESKEEFLKIVEEWKHTPLLFEERLKGEEASVFFWIHPQGESFSVQFLGSAKDYKRRFDNDEGPNTGGMGAQSPHPTLNDAELSLCKTWALDTAKALKEKGILYSGPLFMGLMKDQNKGWCLLEYNARFGDPETQALVLRWKNNHFLRSNLGLSVSENLDPELSADKALCLALVHPKYPSKGEPIELPAWKINSEKLKNTPDIKTEIFLTGSTAGRMAYLCLTGKTNTSISLGNLATELMKDSPWATILNWRRDPLNDI